MRTLAALIRKELLALSRDLHGLAALFLMPALFIIVMSLALQDVYRPAQRTSLKPLSWAVEVQDPGQPAQALLRRWRELQGDPTPLPADVAAALRRGALKYRLVLQPGLSAELTRAGLPTTPTLRLDVDPGLDPSTFLALQAQLLGVAGDVKARLTLAQEGLSQAPGASMTHLLVAERQAGAGPRPSAVQQNVPAWLVFGLFFVATAMSHLMVQERDSGTLARLRSLGVAPATLLASKALPYLGVNALQAVLMLALGAWLLPLLGGDALSLAGVNQSALVAALAACSAAAVATGLALAAWVRTATQAFAIGPVCSVLMAAIGGIMVPTFVMPAGMQRLAAWSPMNWGLEALLAVLLRDADVAALTPWLLRLLAFAVVMAGVAVWVMQRRFR